MQQSVGALPGAAGSLTGTGPSQTESDRRGAVRKEWKQLNLRRSNAVWVVLCRTEPNPSPMGEVFLSSWITWNVGTGSGCGSWTRLSRKSQSWSCRGGSEDEIPGLEWRKWRSHERTEELHVKLSTICAAGVAGVLLTCLLRMNFCHDVILHTDVSKYIKYESAWCDGFATSEKWNHIVTYSVWSIKFWWKYNRFLCGSSKRSVYVWVWVCFTTLKGSCVISEA